MISPRRALVVAGFATFLLALVHVLALAIGPPAFVYLDAPDLAALMKQGSPWPTVMTLGVIVILSVFSAYAFSAAGLVRRLPLLKPILTLVGGVLVIRGLGVVWFVYLVLVRSPNAIPREIGFSLVALAVGLLFLFGRRAV